MKLAYHLSAAVIFAALRSAGGTMASATSQAMQFVPSMSESCDQTTSTSAACTSNWDGGGAGASSVAAFGFVMAQATADNANANGEAGATADAGSEFLLMIPGSGQQLITGTYAITLEGECVTSVATIIQAGSTNTIPDCEGSQLLQVRTVLDRGKPFKFFMEAFAQSSTPGPDLGNVSIQFQGFFDQGGAPVAFTVVPEDSTTMMILLALAFARSRAARMTRF